MANPSSHAAPPAGSSLSFSGLQALLESARLLNASLSLEDMLRHLLRTVMGRLLVTRGVIALADAGEMRVELARGVPGLGKGSLLRQADAASANLDLLYPIGPPHEPVGLLALARPALGTITPEQEQLLSGLLELAAAALANARLHEQTVRVARSLDQNVQELRAILDLARGLATKLEADEIAHLLALTLAGRWTVRKHALAAWRDGHPPVVRRRGMTLPDAQTLRAAVAELKEPAYFAEALPDCARVLLSSDPAGVVFPIRAGEEAIGVVLCGARAGGLGYTPADLEFGAGLIAQAAVAFENAWRLKEILARQQIEQELSIAAGIQQSLFPSVMPALPATDIAAHNRQARQVGGDYYDVLPMDGGGYLLCVADISGKGLPAALLMSTIQATLRATIGTRSSIADLATRVNALLHASTPSNKFATAFLLAYDPTTGSGVYANGGHNDGIVLRRDASVELLPTTGLPLGLFATAAYEEGCVTLDPGDLLMLYSDGVPEAWDVNEEDFGMDRIIGVLKTHHDQPAARIVNAMLESIDSFAGPAPQHDDITLMVVKRDS